MPKSKIEATLKKVAAGTPKASSPSSSNAINATLGDPNCPHCHGAGYIRTEASLGDPRFGRLEPCVCRSVDIVESARKRLFEMSHLDRLDHLTFENFSSQGNKNAKFLTPQDAHSLQVVREMAENFARTPQGWLLLEGGYGSGKTHLAAAIANHTVNRGIPTLFLTVPDLLDELRYAYNDPETTFEARFDQVRNAAVLVLDDFGTQNATGWGQEKLFQIMNYRYINKLPTVITTNLMLDEIESRIRSRLQDEAFVAHATITAPDYRRPTETSNPGISLLSLTDMKAMTFKSFETREDEIGKDVETVTTTESKDRFGNPVKQKVITRVQITQKDVNSLRTTVNEAVMFAEEPDGWLVLLGASFCGKTHLAAAIGNYRIDLGGQATMVNVAELFDYLRQPFGRASDVPFNRRFNEIKTTPMLILDDLKESDSTSTWEMEKLIQTLNHRYYAHLPTVITSTLTPRDFALNYPGLWNKLLDTSKVQIHVIDMPPYRRIARTRKTTAGHKKSK
jgi:DNA replication protein DnaC